MIHPDHCYDMSDVYPGDYEDWSNEMSRTRPQSPEEALRYISTMSIVPVGDTPQQQADHYRALLTAAKNTALDALNKRRFPSGPDLRSLQEVVDEIARDALATSQQQEPVSEKEKESSEGESRPSAEQ